MSDKPTYEELEKQARELAEALLESKRLTLAMNRIPTIFLTVSDEKMYEEVLEIVLETMESQYGVFGYIDRNGDLVCPSMIGKIWDRCEMPDKVKVFPRSEWRGMWGQAMIEKKILYANKPFSPPKGHVPIDRAMLAPIVYKGETIGFLPIANKKTDYTEADKVLMGKITECIAPVLNARLQRDRQEKERGIFEDALRKEKQELKIIFDSSPTMIFYKDRDGKFVRVNKAFADAFEMTEDELAGKTAFDLLSSAIAQGMTDDDQEVFQSGRPKLNIEEEYESASGRRWVQTDKIPINDENGIAVGLIGFAQDITERKIYEGNFKKAQEVALLGSWEWDIVNDKIERSEVLYSILGSTKQDFCENYGKLQDLIHPDDRVMHREKVENALAGKEDHDFDYRIIRPDGQVRVLYSKAEVVRDKDGKPIFMRGITQDITERKQIEDFLRESEMLIRKKSAEVEQKNIALREVIDQVAMEKDQLTDRVSANIERVLLPVLAKLKERAAVSEKKYLEMIEQGLNELTSSFGSKISDKRLSLTPREIEICALIKKGLSSKEISELFNISPGTVEVNRANIRKKLGLSNKKINLVSFLNENFL